MRGSRRRHRSGVLGILVLGLWSRSVAAAGGEPVNLAPRARVTASSCFSSGYLPQFAADGKVPGELGRADEGQAWCVAGKDAADRGWLRLEWDEPATVAEVVYLGRTAWMLSECWKDYELWFDDASEPAARGQFDMRHGSQRIPIPPSSARKLTLKFLSSHGGLNPGASEILVFASSPSEEELARCLNPRHSPELAERLARGALGFDRLLLIQRRAINPSHVYTYHNEGFEPGGGLYTLPLGGPGGRDGGLEELVASPGGQILDCDLSHDAREVLFSWREGTEATYHVWRAGIDGTGRQQLTDGDAHDFNACWLPDGGIAFLSTRRPAFAYCWTSPVGVLHRMDRDGKDVLRISGNYLNDFTPAVLNDGRIIYGRWEYVDRPAIPIQSLWTIHPDGTQLGVFFGNRVLSPATFIEPRPVPGTNKILCTLTAHNGPCRGAIGLIDPARGLNAQEAIANLTPEVDIGRVDRGDGNNIHGPYESPYPVDPELFLASRGGTIILRDFQGTREVEVIAPRSGMGFYGVQPVRPRAVPPRLASTLPAAADTGGAWATVFLDDVYDGLEPRVKRGEVRQICVVQEIEKSRFADVKHRAFGFQFPVVSCGATYAPKKIWGYAAVAGDGSASFRVPAGVPVYFMALDAEGRAVQRMRSFTHLMPGEVQGCRGCHGRDNRSPRQDGERVRAALGAGPPQDLEPPEWGLEGFSYAHVVQPVLDRYCVRCHNAHEAPKGVDLTGDVTDFFSVSYEVLARQGTAATNAAVGGVASWTAIGFNPYTRWIATYNGAEGNILAVEPKTWGSPASLLADLILAGHPESSGKRRFDMDPASRRRIFAWIDLNVPYYGTSSSVYTDRLGCRRLIPDGLEETLQRVGQRRCASCHAKGADGKVSVPRKFYVRVTNPRHNDFLLAPLARDAGGTGACGKSVFASRDDPDYRAILETFDPLLEMLRETPREDLAAKPKDD